MPTMKEMKAHGIPPFLFACLLLLLGAGAAAAPRTENPPLPGDFPASAFPDNWQARRELKQSLLMAPTSTALAWKDRRYSAPGVDLGVRVVSQGDYFYIVFENERGGKYVTYSQGSWVVKRSRKDGRFVQAKVFLRSDPGVFARIFPFKDRSKMEIIVYGAVDRRDLLLPLPFEEIIGQPFSKIMEYSSAWVDWSFLSPPLGLYRGQEDMIKAIRARLKDLEYRDDGALDASGKPVFINDGSPQEGKPGLNCSGFAKWVVDGLYAPLVLERTPADADPGPLLLPIDKLKLRLTELRGTSFSSLYEDSRDPYFGLDWIRNLGKALSDILYPDRSAGPEDRDVNVHPFSQVTGVGEILNTRLPFDSYPDFAPNVGYRVSGLRPLFYKLAIEDPGSFYLGAFCTDKGSREPALTQFYHIAVFFPRFDGDGIFHTEVFESCAETSLDAVVKRVPDNFLFLVRMPGSARFDFKAASGVLAR